MQQKVCFLLFVLLKFEREFISIFYGTASAVLTKMIVSHLLVIAIYIVHTGFGNCLLVFVATINKFLWLFYLPEKLIAFCWSLRRHMRLSGPTKRKYGASRPHPIKVLLVSTERS